VNSPRPEDRFVVAVPKYVAEALVPFLPSDSRIFEATQQMAMVNPELRTALFNTVSELRAAARQSRAARRELAVVGNLAEEVRGVSEESETKGTPPNPDPAGVGLLRSDAAGALLGISSRRVRQLCEEGLLEAEKPGIEWIITRESVDQYRALKDIGRSAA
jgi:hypothetical protein